MIRFLLRRLGFALLAVWFILTASFAIAHLIPADPARAAVGPHADARTLAQARAQMGLDRPVVVQYGRFLAHLARGELGRSFRTGRPIGPLLAERAWPTAQLALATVLLELLIGIPLGLWAALRRQRALDWGIAAVTLAGQCAPVFFLGPLLLYGLAYRWPLFPVGGYGDGGLARLYHLILPALTLAVGGIAYSARLTRGELGEALGEPFMRTARAKGLSPTAAALRHGLRNALGPVIALLGVELGGLLGGVILVESIFGWPGLGREAVVALYSLDLPVVLGVVLVSAVAVALANLLADLVHLVLDPRIRFDYTLRR